MTSIIRNADLSNFQTGSGKIWTIYIQIRWPVITVPALIVGFGVIFLAVCIWQTKNAGLRPWKEQLLPSLVAGLEGETRRAIRDKLDEKGWEDGAFEEVCKTLKVTLKDSKRPELHE